MNETITFEAVSIEQAEVNLFDSENHVADYIDPEIDDGELFNLVAQNAHVIVKFGGSEMTLSEAMWQISITKESILSVISTVRDLLANREAEIEDAVEDDEAEQDEPEEIKESSDKDKAKTEAQELPKNLDKIDKLPQPKEEFDRNKQPIPSINQPIQPTVRELATKPKVITKLETKQADNHNAGTDLVPKTVETIISEPTKQSVAPAAQIESRISHEVSEIGPVTVAEQSTLAFEIANNEVSVSIAAETPPPPAGYGPSQESATEQNKSPLVNELGIELEPFEKLPLGAIRHNIEQATLEQADEPANGTEAEPPIALLELEADADGLAEFTDEIFLLDHQPTDYPELDGPQLTSGSSVIDFFYVLEPGQEIQIIQPETKSDLKEPMDVTVREQFSQADIPIVEAEACLVLLSDHIEVSQPETLKTVNEILDTIIELPAKLEAFNDEDIVSEAQVQEELGELLAELLEIMDTEYTPELIESLAELTLKWHLADEIEKLRNEEAADQTPQGRGTHEIIRELLAKLGTIQQPKVYAYAIGKTALKLAA